MNSLLKVEGLTCSRSGRSLFRHLDLEVKPSEAVLLSGPNGSGKTTFLRALTGEVVPEGGSVLLCGRSLADWLSWERERVAPLVDQDPKIDLSVRTWHNLVDSLVIQRPIEWWIGSGSQLLPAIRQENFLLLEAFGLSALLEQPASRLSFGQRRLLTLVRALRLPANRHPRLLLLDEPFSGLTEEHATAVIEIIRDRISSGWSVLVAEHLPIVKKVGIDREINFPFPG